MYYKNGSPMLPNLFPKLINENPELKTAYYECMNDLDNLEGEAKGTKKLEYFDKNNKSGKLYELLTKYFNIEAIDYCDSIFTENTVMINPMQMNDPSVKNDPSLYYPSWEQLKDNILSSKNDSGNNNYVEIFNFLSS